MMTARQLSETIVENFKLENNEEPKPEDITSSSVLAVALEHLGQLPDNHLKLFAQSRDGVLYHWSNKDKENPQQAFLTLRELIGLLDLKSDLQNAFRQAKEALPDYPWEDDRPTGSQMMWALTQAYKGVCDANDEWQNLVVKIQNEIPEAKKFVDEFIAKELGTSI